ncbi:MAG TPA: SAM-dependent methyltransferase [Streptosporangiaceae bacterium]|nr:SAM-dependent methyltransferase [Streptosporangiaceae bacterium]
MARIVSAVPPGAHRARTGPGGTADRGGRQVTPDRQEAATDPTARPAAPFDTTVAHQARVYDYWLGGKDNFAADREAAEQAIRDFPAIVAGVKEQRAFLARAVRYLAGPAGIRQFLDIGTGLPSANNTHEVAQAAAPESRVVYVDNDPLVLTYARALLASGPNGTTAYLDADLRDTASILEQAAGTLDFSQPVAILLIGVLQLIEDTDEPRAIIGRLLDAVPSGSWLALVHPASDVVPEVVTMARHLSQRSVIPTTLRTHAEVTRFFDGLELLPPGVVQLHHWRPEAPPEEGKLVPAYCGLARKS